MQEDRGLKKPNPFQIEVSDGWVSGYPDIPVRCPHCGTMGSFKSAVKDSSILRYRKRADTGEQRLLFATLRICPNPNCAGLVFTIENSRREIIEVLPRELIDFDREDIPEKLLNTLKEAVSCHAAGAYRATAIMVRRLLEERCQHNSAQGNTLHDRIMELQNKITLPKDLFDAMAELKALGNDAAHVDAKSYNTIDEGEAEDSIELAKEILKARYQLKGLVERLKDRKKKKTAGA